MTLLTGRQIDDQRNQETITTRVNSRSSGTSYGFKGLRMGVIAALALAGVSVTQGCGWWNGGSDAPAPNAAAAPTPPTPVAVPPAAATAALDQGVTKVAEAFRGSSEWAKDMVEKQLKCETGSPCAAAVQHAKDEANAAALGDKITTLTGQLTYRESQIQILQLQLVQKDGEIARLNEVIRSLERELAQCKCEKDCQKVQDEIDDKKNQRRGKEKEREKIQEQIDLNPQLQGQADKPRHVELEADSDCPTGSSCD